ncbi:MAG: CehA/McbA family metallohydrolase [Halioglobus sp.]
MKKLLLTIALFLTPQAQAQAPEFFAAQLTPETLHRLPAGGMAAIGGANDWFLSNGELCAVVSDAGHPTYLALHGAALVDLWHCERANDQWNVAHAQLNLQKDQIPRTTGISAGVGSTTAWLETRGEHAGVQTVVRYVMDAAQPDTLQVETRLTRVQAGDALRMFGSLVLHPGSSLTPFTVDSQDVAYTTGFSQPAVDTSDYLSLLNAVSPADTQVLIGSRNTGADISYTLRLHEALLRDAQGNEEPVHTLLVSGDTFSLFAAFTRPFPRFWSRAPGVISLALGQLFDLETGESLILRQSITAAASADAAATLNALYTGHSVQGRLDTLDASVTARDTAGRELNFARPDASGDFTLRLPRGITAITLDVRTPWSSTQQSVALAAPLTELGVIDTGAPAVVELPRGEAMSLVFTSDAGQPVFNDELTSASVAGERHLVAAESHRLSLSGGPGDPRELALPAGSYRVLASRGPEFNVTEAALELVAGTRSVLAIAPPRRAVESEGLISADFHVHSGISFDSSLTAQQRVRDFVAQGCEVLVPTEHNVLYDLAPTIADMGLQQVLFSFPGVEVTGMARSPRTPYTIGHSNVFPVVPAPGEFMRGNLHFEGKRLGEVISAYKARFRNSLFQLNHPRSTAQDDDGAFFDHLSQGAAFEPAKDLQEAPNASLLEQHPGSAYRDIDFDAIELLNGTDLELYQQVRGDWFALLRQGVYKVATANSDSHKSHHLVAYPRNMLALEDAEGFFDASAAGALADDSVKVGRVMRALAAGNLYGTTGPILRVDVDGTGPGGTHSGTAGTLTVSVDAAPWVAVDTLRIWLNGGLWKTLAIAPGQTVAEALPISEDGFVFVEVLGQPTPAYATVAPGAIPFAFANPVLLDAEGDGWHAHTAAAP